MSETLFVVPRHRRAAPRAAARTSAPTPARAWSRSACVLGLAALTRAEAGVLGLLLLGGLLRPRARRPRPLAGEPCSPASGVLLMARGRGRRGRSATSGPSTSSSRCRTTSAPRSPARTAGSPTPDRRSGPGARRSASATPAAGQCFTGFNGSQARLQRGAGRRRRPPPGPHLRPRPPRRPPEGRRHAGVLRTFGLFRPDAAGPAGGARGPPAGLGAGRHLVRVGPVPARDRRRRPARAPARRRCGRWRRPS